MTSMSPTWSGESNTRAFARPPAASLDAVLLGEADLGRIEQALLDAILDVRADGTNAVDRLLRDMHAADGSNDDTTSAADRDAGNSRRKRMEELLFTAVDDTTPDRGRALDRLLGETPDFGIHVAYA